MISFEPTEAEVMQAMRGLEKKQAQIKKAFMYVKQLSLAKFQKWVNDKTSQAYFIAVDELKQAMECCLSKKQVEQVMEKYEEIRNSWDDIQEIEINYEEFDLYDLMEIVSKEMKRAARIHGERFKDYAEAKEAILEEINEIWMAHESEGDIIHAKSEALQAIGTLIKYIRTVEK